MKIVTPQVFMIAATAINPGSLDAALDAVGAPPADFENPSGDPGQDAATLTEFAGKSCYMSFDTALNKNLTRAGTKSTADYIRTSILNNKHGSVLEHASVTFYLVNVSRVVTHELVRHRAGTAFSQVSGRYVRTDEIDAYVPKDITASPEALSIFTRAFQVMETAVKELAAVTEVDARPFAVKKRLTSAFRRIIGNGQANHIVVTANHRAWRHMIALRTAADAEEEIRVVFAAISRELRLVFPEIYSDADVHEIGGIEVTTFTNEKI